LITHRSSFFKNIIYRTVVLNWRPLNMKPLRLHYESNHKANFKMLEAKLREDKLKILKSCLKQQQYLFIKANESSEATVQASFTLAQCTCYCKTIKTIYQWRIHKRMLDKVC